MGNFLVQVGFPVCAVAQFDHQGIRAVVKAVEKLIAFIQHIINIIGIKVTGTYLA